MTSLTPIEADTVIAARTVSAAARQADISVNVVDYGAVGDGVTDDTAAINQAIYDMAVRGPGDGGTVLIPYGRYLLTAPIILYRGVHLIGEGFMCTALIQTGDGAVIQYYRTGSVQFDTEIAHMTLVGNEDDTTTGDGINVETAKGISYPYWHDLSIQSCGRDGIHIDQPDNPWWVQWLTMERVHVSSVNGCDITAHSCQGYGMNIQGGVSTCSFRDCDFMHADLGGVLVEDTGSSGVYRLVFDRSRFEQNGTDLETSATSDAVVHGLHIGSTGAAYGVRATNCYFEGNGRGDTTRVSSGVYVDNVFNRNITIDNSYFNQFHRGVSFIKCRQGSVTDNYFSYDGATPSSAGTCIVVGSSVASSGIHRARNTAVSGEGLTLYSISADDDVTCENYTLSIAADTFSPTDSRTYYFGAFPSQAPDETALHSAVRIPKAGRIRRIDCYIYSDTAGTAENWSLYVRLNNTTDTLVQTKEATTNMRLFSNGAMDVEVAPDDYIQMKLVCPAWDTNPADCHISGTIFIDPYEDDGA